MPRDFQAGVRAKIPSHGAPIRGSTIARRAYGRAKEAPRHDDGRVAHATCRIMPLQPGHGQVATIEQPFLERAPARSQYHRRARHTPSLIEEE